MLPVVAIIGRPNVGKSTLFNRLIGRQSALVDPTPGVTRDRREGEGKLGSLQFTVLDTAGLADSTAVNVEEQMQQQTLKAIKDADVILFLIDAREGVTPLDESFAQLIRRLHSRVILVANKCESKASSHGLLEAYRLGFGEPVAVASEHGIGFPDLEGAINGLYEKFGLSNRYVEEKPPIEEEIDRKDIYSEPLQLAIVGRPNVGKSTMINSLLGSERVITGPEPGITRDAISILWNWKNNKIKLIDTAGMRRKARISERLEKMSVADTLEAIRFAHVVVLVVDATMMPERQDLVIARHVIDEGRAIVIAVNKCDSLQNMSEALDVLFDRIEISLPQIRGVPVVTLSAIKHQGMQKLLKEVINAYELWNKRIGTASLNKWLQRAVEIHPPPVSRGRRIRIRYITQTKTRPPTFAIFASRPAGLPESYVRYLINGIRVKFTLPGIPIRISLRRPANPYAPGKGHK